MSLFGNILKLAAFIPGPQQPFVAGAGLLGGIGEHAYNRAHGDSDYRQAHPAFDIGAIGQQGLNTMMAGPADPLRQLLMRLHGQQRPTLGPGDFPMGGGGGFYG